MSKEMLELAKRIAERAATNAGVAPELLYAPVLWELQADASRVSLPAPEAAPTREEIAKIIDPDAKFEDIDGVQWSKFELQRRELAYQKADAILALKSAPAK